MFNFLDMAFDYDQMAVDRFEGLGMCIDTARVTDGSQPYETGVAHPEYNGGKWIIVEAYDTKEEAKKGHAKWVQVMTENPPDQLVDCQNSYISNLLDKEDLTFNRIVDVTARNG